MDAFNYSATHVIQVILGQLLAQVNSPTNQFQNAGFEANNAEVYPTFCRYCNGPHMSIDC